MVFIMYFVHRFSASVPVLSSDTFHFEADSALYSSVILKVNLLEPYVLYSSKSKYLSLGL